MASATRAQTVRRLARIHRQLGIPPDYGRVRRLPVQPEPARLVTIGRNSDGRQVRLSPAAAAAWRRMKLAAEADAITLVPVSGYRSIRRQTRLIRDKLESGRAIADILRLMAAPGHSEHHTGRAIDIGSPDDCELDEAFERTAAFQWLHRHAKRFGFVMSYPRKSQHGIGYEPWHWGWRPHRR